MIFIKKFFSFLLCFILLFASLSCGKKDSGEPDEINNFESNNAANETDGFLGGVIEDMPNPFENLGAKTLQVASLETYKDFFIYMEKALATKHPQIKFAVTYFDDAFSYARELKTMIASGAYLPDLFVAPVHDEFLDDIEMQGMLADIYGLMKHDPYFAESEWFINAIHAYARNGGLYEMPMGVTPVFFGINNRVPEDMMRGFAEREKINIYEMIECLEQNEAQCGLLFAGQNAERIHRYANLGPSDGGYALMAEFVGGMLFSDTAWSVTDYNFNLQQNTYFSEAYLFTRMNYSARHYMLHATRTLNVYTGAVPLADSDGRLLLDRQHYPMRFSICEASSSKEAAWELVKFFSDPYAHVRSTRGFFETELFNYSSSVCLPVNKTAARNVTDILVYQIHYDTSMSSTFSLKKEEQINYLMNFYEKVAQNDFTYDADDWKPRAMFSAFAQFFIYAGTHGNPRAASDEVLQSLRQSYDEIVSGDAFMHLIAEISSSDENKTANPWMYKNESGRSVSEWERMGMILQHELFEAIVAYAY